MVGSAHGGVIDSDSIASLRAENERLQRELEFMAMERVESDEVLALRILIQNLKAIIKRAHVSPQDSVAVSEILLEE